MLASGVTAMGKKKTKTQIQKEELELKLAAVRRALTRAKDREKADHTGPKKRKDIIFLARYLGVPLASQNAIRARSEFTAKSYNLGRQVVALIDHVFVRYPTPMFLYRSVLSRAGVQLVFGNDQIDVDFWRDCGTQPYVRWFLVAAQGGSLAKAMSDHLSRKEAHWFQQAPTQNSIGQNIFWAQCAAVGIPAKVCQFLTERLGASEMRKAMGDRTEDVIRFYANACGSMRESDLREITDFVQAMVRTPDFSFKGRTFGSMLKLCHEWHHTVYSVRIAQDVSWAPSFQTWKHNLKSSVVTAVELTNNRALADEGKRQRHCVYGYTLACSRGMSKIVSLRWVVPSGEGEYWSQELNRLTLEINPQRRAIVQIRGHMNRLAETNEMKIVRLWAGDHGLLVED